MQQLARTNKKYYYTIKEKLDIIDLYNSKDNNGQPKFSKAEILKKYKTDHKTFDRWLINENKFRFSNDLDKKTLHRGRNNKISEKDQKYILDTIKTLLENKIPINYKDIVKIIYSKKLISFKNISKTSCYFRIYRFLKKHLYVKRRGTHIGQRIPENAFNLAQLFLHEIIKKRNRYNYNLSNIINCDETPITLDNPYTFTLAKKGEKIISVHTNVKEKNRLSCILTIAANGNK